MQNDSDADKDVGLEEGFLLFDFGDHELKTGVTKANFNMADKISSGKKMFFEDAANDKFEGGKGVGLGYAYKGSCLTFLLTIKTKMQTMV